MPKANAERFAKTPKINRKKRILQVSQNRQLKTPFVE